MRNEDLVNKGWDEMLNILDQEMPQKENKRRPIIWFWFGASAIIGIIVLAVFGIKPTPWSAIDVEKVVSTATDANQKNLEILNAQHDHEKETTIIEQQITTPEISKSETPLSIAPNKNIGSKKSFLQASIHQNKSETLLKINPKKPTDPLSVNDFENYLINKNQKTNKNEQVVTRDIFKINPLSITRPNFLFKSNQAPLFNIKFDEIVDIQKKDKRNYLALGLGLAVSPKRSLTGLQFGLSYQIAQSARLTHGPSLSMLALGLDESNKNTDLLLEELDGMDNSNDEESMGGEVDPGSLNGGRVSQEVLTGTLYQINASYGLNYKVMPNLSLGFDLGYAYALNSKSTPQDMILNLGFTPPENMTENRVRAFVRPNIHYSLGQKFSLNLSYQLHEIDLFKQSQDSRKYDYFNFVMTYRIY